MNRTPLRRTLVALALVTLVAIPAMAKDEALSLVPANAVTVGMVKVAELRTSPLASFLFQQTDKMSTDGEAEKFLTEAGLSVTKDIDVLVVATAPRTALGTEADALVIAEGRFNAERLTSALVARGAVKKDGYLVLPEEKNDGPNPAVAFPSASLVIGRASCRERV